MNNRNRTQSKAVIIHGLIVTHLENNKHLNLFRNNKGVMCLVYQVI